MLIPYANFNFPNRVILRVYINRLFEIRISNNFKSNTREVESIHHKIAMSERPHRFTFVEACRALNI